MSLRQRVARSDTCPYTTLVGWGKRRSGNLLSRGSPKPSPAPLPGSSMSDEEEQHLCAECQHGLVVRAVDAEEVDTYSFCNLLSAPLKFVGSKRVVDCTGFKQKK